MIAWSYLDIKLWGHVICCGVHLDDLYILGCHFLTQLVIDGSQLLAVAAPRRKKSETYYIILMIMQILPRSVKFNQHILFALGNELVKILGNSNLDGVG